MDLSSYGITSRLNAADTERQGNWMLPLVSAISPNTAAVGSTFTLAITGTNLQAVKDIEFHIAGYGSGMGGGMMGGGTAREWAAKTRTSRSQMYRRTPTAHR